MASGSFGNGSGQNCALRISWSSSAGTGGSTVSATLVAQNQNNAYFSATVFSTSITINGNTKGGGRVALSGSMNGAVNLVSHSVWVGYTGNKSITISGVANFGDAGIWSLSNQSISGTAALDRVGSAPTMGSVTSPSTSTVSETTTSITVTWNKASSYNNSCTYAIGCSVNGGAYSIVYPNNNINTTSYTWNIGNPAQGTTYQFAVCCANDIATSGWQYSGVVTINKINAPSIGDIGTYNPYSNSTLTIPLSGGSQTNGGNLVRMCDLYYGGTWLATCRSYDNTSWWNTSQTISYAAGSYAAYIGSGAYSSGSFRIVAWCENSNRSRSGYVEKYFTVNLNTDGGATPTLGTPTISGGAFGYTGTCFIAGVSTVNVSSPAGSLRRAPSGTSISYSISCTGTGTQWTQNAKFSGLTAGVKTITVTATDSRGLSTSVSRQIRVQAYSNPTVRNFTCNRLDNPQTSAKLSYTLSYSPIYQYSDINTQGSQLNGIKTQRYTIGSGFVECTSGTVITGLSTDSVYTVGLDICDNVGRYVSVPDVRIPTIKTNLALRKWGVGINCIPQASYGLEVNGAAHVTGQLNADSSVAVNGTLNVLGDIVYKVGGRSRTPIKMFAGNADGDGIKIEAGGCVVMGSGESPSAFISGANPGGGTETTYITSDNDVVFETNLQNGYSNVKEVRIDSRGRVNRKGYGETWINGRNTALVYSGYCGSTNLLNAVSAIGTNSGVWTLGTVGETCYLSYTTDANYNNGNNTANNYDFPNSGGWASVLRKAFPVGAVYITYNNNNPGNFLGGTWVQFGQGRTLVGEGTGNDGSTSMSFSANAQGGNYKNTHDHYQTNSYDGASIYMTVSGNAPRSRTLQANRIVVNGTRGNSITREDATYNTTIDIVQPYITVYYWRRTS